MAEIGSEARYRPVLLLALALARGRRLALVVSGRSRWQCATGYTLVPAELPGGIVEPDALPVEAAAALAVRHFNQPARVLSSRQLYGPSDAHTIDRLPAAAADDPLPLLRLERSAPLDAAATLTVRRIVVTVYRARLGGQPVPGDGAAGLLWLPLHALRLAMRGIALVELTQQVGAEWQPDRESTIPDNTLIYVPADYGERHLLRLAAKYGEQALFQGDDDDG
ncbi:MAG: hypothetical protein ACHQ4H_06910 [Ktedonobacterales bacterium]